MDACLMACLVSAIDEAPAGDRLPDGRRTLEGSWVNAAPAGAATAGGKWNGGEVCCVGAWLVLYGCGSFRCFALVLLMIDSPATFLAPSLTQVTIVARIVLEMSG